nr:MAG TPA: hypothetical protein [Caudoviricetes sp.]
MPRKRMRLILRRNFAIAKKLREKLHRQNPFTKLVASLNRHGSAKSDISDKRGYLLILWAQLSLSPYAEF